MTKPKLSDVMYQEASYAPIADCRGIWDRSGEQDVQTEACSWKWRPVQYGFVSGSPPGEAKKQAKWHALYHPGHEILVTRLTEAIYWLDPPKQETETTGITVDDGIKVQQLNPDQVLREVVEEGP